MNKPQDPNKKKRNPLLLAAGLGLEFFALSLGGVFGGYYIGEIYGQGALSAIAGFIIASGIWIWRLIRIQRELL
jgi:hypothetical protein